MTFRIVAIRTSSGRLSTADWGTQFMRKRSSNIGICRSRGQEMTRISSVPLGTPQVGGVGDGIQNLCCVFARSCFISLGCLGIQLRKIVRKKEIPRQDYSTEKP
jgi:hypothetical protein